MWALDMSQTKTTTLRTFGFRTVLSLGSHRMSTNYPSDLPLLSSNFDIMHFTPAPGSPQTQRRTNQMIRGQFTVCISEWLCLACLIQYLGLFKVFFLGLPITLKDSTNVGGLYRRLYLSLGYTSCALHSVTTQPSTN